MACRTLSASSDGEESLRIGVARLKAAVLCCLLIWCSAAAAQEGSSSRASEASKAAAAAAGRPTRPSRPRARVEEAQPSLYYLKDKQGNLQAVPNFSFEDFEELYRLKHQLAQGDQRPRYSIQQISAGGTANGRLRRADHPVSHPGAGGAVAAGAAAPRPGRAPRAAAIPGPGRAVPALRGRQRGLRALDSRSRRAAAASHLEDAAAAGHAWATKRG